MSYDVDTLARRSSINYTVDQRIDRERGMVDLQGRIPRLTSLLGRVADAEAFNADPRETQTCLVQLAAAVHAWIEDIETELAR